MGAAFAAAATMVWSLGVFFVTLTWLIEAASFFEWSASEPARALQIIDPVASSKSHLVALLRRTGARLTGKRSRRAARRHTPPDLRLVDMPRIPFLPVGLASATWYFVLGAAGSWIVGLPMTAFATVFVAIGVMGAVVAALPLPGRWQLVKLAVAAAPVVIGYPVLFSISGLGSVPETVRLSFCVLCAVVPSMVFRLFAPMNYEQTRAVVARAWAAAGRLLIGVYDLISGVDPRKRYETTLPR
jgi:hypothetical protein